MKDVLKGMDRFGSKVCPRMSLRNKIYLIPWYYFSYFENHWRVFIFFIFKHPVKGLSYSNVNLSALCQLESIIDIFPFFTLELRIRIMILRLDMANGIKAESLKQLILGNIEHSFLFIFISNFFLKLLSTQARFFPKLTVPFETSPRVSYFKYVPIVILYYWK